jgi:GNAT superfamily N-acetyltransferase
MALQEYEALLAAEPGQWIQELARSDETRLRSGEVRAFLWVHGADQAAGLALGDFVPGVGRRLRVYLAPPYRTAEDLGRLLDELDARSEQDGAIASVADLVPGLTEAAHEEAFGVRGYFRVDRVAMRLPANVPLPDESMSGRPYLRTIGPDDEEGLVNLMRESYDQLAGEAPPWLFYRDPRQDTVDAVQEILEGRRGEWLPWASFGVDVEGVLKGATLVTLWDVPILSEVMVAPACRRIGLGYHLVLESIRALRERGAGEPHVVTTSRDLRSLRLARRLGFEPAEVRAVGVWVNKVAVGVPPPSVH